MSRARAEAPRRGSELAWKTRESLSRAASMRRLDRCPKMIGCEGVNHHHRLAVPRSDSPAQRLTVHPVDVALTLYRVQLVSVVSPSGLAFPAERPPPLSLSGPRKRMRLVSVWWCMERIQQLSRTRQARLAPCI